MKIDAGNILRARLIQKLEKVKESFPISLKIIVDMRYPLITKKMSTPTKPPGTNPKPE